ncbi:hypothetical protein IWQ61_005110 [Dispira simplex]|nr:hypothetical protein IWQ61_005110 [Dispira simplex]
MSEERRSSQNPSRRIIQERTTIGTPGGISQRGNGSCGEILPCDVLEAEICMGKILPYDAEYAEDFVVEFEKYAEYQEWSDKRKRRGLYEYLPKKLRRKIKEFDDISWSVIRKYLLDYGAEKEARDREKLRKKRQEKLQSFGDKKILEKKLGRFLVDFRLYADVCKEISDTEKLGILLRVVPKCIRKLVFVALSEEDFTLGNVLSWLGKYVKEEAEWEECFEKILVRLDSEDEEKRVRRHSSAEEIGRLFR